MLNEARTPHLAATGTSPLIEQANVATRNEKQIIISSFKAPISAILRAHWKIVHLVICPFDYGS